MSNSSNQNPIVITNCTEFLENTLELLKENKERATYFRGHSCFRYLLEPSLFRLEKELVLHEPHMVRELLLAKPEEFASDQTTLDKLARMQHFGMPTRLLDLTSNPLMALFFAASGGISTSQCDGEVLILNVKMDKIRFFDSDTVSCVANLALLDRKWYDAIDEKIDRYEFNKTEPVQRWLHHIKDEKPYFKDCIVPEDTDTVICVRSRMNNVRIAFQSGAFLLFGRHGKINEQGSENFHLQRIRIAAGKKGDILKELDRLNINDSTVYPFLENSAKHIVAKYKTKKEKKS